MQAKIFLLLACGIVALARTAAAQDSTGALDKVLNFPDVIFAKLEKKTARLQARLERQSEKYLERLARREQKLRKKISKIDSSAGKELFNQSAAKYQELAQKLKGRTDAISSANNYISHLDSMQTALKFLDASKLIGQSTAIQASLKKTFNDYQQLQGKFNQAEDIKRFLQERQKFLREQIEKFGLTKQFRKLQKDIYYYRAQVEEWKNDFSSPTRIETRLLQIANKIPAFHEFFIKHSELATMFRLPGNDPIQPASLTGLQTRAMVMQDLQQRFGSGPDFQQQLNQSLSNAQAQLSQLRNKINQLGGNGNDLEMPDFKPNQQKTRRFLQRLEGGLNVQSSKSNYFFPVTTDVGLTLGYKINSKSVAGVGVAYKMGWGKDIRHLQVTHQGIGFRSYVDVKMKGSLWITGGGELNYQQPFKDFDVLKNFNPWQKSALLGLSKKYNVGRKWKGNLQLLYDFLAKPGVESPLKFRTGYNF